MTIYRTVIDTKGNLYKHTNDSDMDRMKRMVKESKKTDTSEEIIGQTIQTMKQYNSVQSRWREY